MPAAALCATVASYSAAPGLLAWPAGLSVLLVRGGAARWRTAGAWALLWAAVWGGYLAGYEAPTGPVSPSFVLGHPAAAGDYLLTFAGGSLFWHEETARAGGLLLVLLAAAALALALALGRIGENAFWVSLGAFSLASLALIAAGRSGFGEAAFAQATLSRYAAFSIPGVAALFGLLANLALKARSRVAALLLCILLAGVARSWQLAGEAGSETEDSRMRAAHILAHYKTEPPAAFTIFGHDPERVRRYARFLDRRDYGIFGETGSQRSSEE